MSDYLIEMVDKELINHGIKPTDLGYYSYAMVQLYYMKHNEIPIALIIFGPEWLNSIAGRIENEIMA